MHRQLELWSDNLVLHNVFFAAKPDRTTAVRIESIAQDIVKRRRLSAKLLPPERLHISLFAIGGFSCRLPSAVISAAQAAAKTISVGQLPVVFDRVASFGGRSGKRALVLTGEEGASGLVRLRKTLRLAMMKAGIGARQPTRFTPHVTMMYTDWTYEIAIEPLSWTVNEFFLVDSLVGQSRHELLGRWPLKASSLKPADAG